MRIELPPFCDLLPVLPLSLSVVLLHRHVCPVPFAAETLQRPAQSGHSGKALGWVEKALVWAEKTWVCLTTPAQPCVSAQTNSAPNSRCQRAYTE
jgi:hypothetical protein